MEIISIKEVQALLIESHELNVPHYGKVKVTRTVTVMCPKLSEKNDGKSIYYRGHSPEQVAQRYINRFLIPTTWGTDDWVTKLGEEA